MRNDRKHRLAVSRAIKKFWRERREEALRIQRKGCETRWSSVEAHAKASERMAKTQSTPEAKERLVEQAKKLPAILRKWHREHPEHSRKNGTKSSRIRWSKSENHKKASEVMKALWACPTNGPKFAKNVCTMHLRFTSIELKLYSFLKEAGIQFVVQHLICEARTIPDAFVPGLNLCLYADGDYWHGLPRVVKKDRQINRDLKKLGYRIFRLKEGRFDKDLARLARLLEKRLSVVS